MSTGRGEQGGYRVNRTRRAGRVSCQQDEESRAGIVSTGRGEQGGYRVNRTRRAGRVSCQQDEESRAGIVSTERGGPKDEKKNIISKNIIDH